MGGASEDVETLKEPDTVREVAKVLRTNVKVCAALGQPSIAQMGRIYLDMLNVYVLLCTVCTVCCVHCVLCTVCCVLWVSTCSMYTTRERKRGKERERDACFIFLP